MRCALKLLWLSCLGLTGNLWATPLVVSYQLETTAPAAEELDNSITFTQSGASPLTYQVQGLPYPGEILWRPALQELAYRHPAEGSWLRVKVSDLPASPPTLAAPAAPWQPWQGNPTRRWTLQAGQTACGALFTAPALGSQTGLGAADLQAVLTLLYWLNTGISPSGCDGAMMPLPASQQAGLPVRWASPLGMLVLTRVEAPTDTPPPLAWPSLISPLEPEARLRLLLVQLPVPERAAFLREKQAYSLVQQIDYLAKKLAASYADIP